MYAHQELQMNRLGDRVRELEERVARLADDTAVAAELYRMILRYFEAKEKADTPKDAGSHDLCVGCDVCRPRGWGGFRLLGC